MKRFVANMAAVVLCVCCLCLIVACAPKSTEEEAKLSYDDIAIEDYVELGAYTGLDVTLLDGESKGHAVWREIMAQSKILGYPEQAVAYYVAQSEERCRFYAKENGVSYDEAMEALGLDAQSMRVEAEEMVRADLVYQAVRKAAGITLSEDEKARFFDRYVDKYVSDWGYDREHVVENLSDLVYDSMLYDKTTEFLILHNEFS